MVGNLRAELVHNIPNGHDILVGLVLSPDGVGIGILPEPLHYLVYNPVTILVVEGQTSVDGFLTGDTVTR